MHYMKRLGVFLIALISVGICQDRIITSQDRIVSSQDRIVSSQDRIVSSQDRIISSQDRIVASQDRIVKSQDQILLSNLNLEETQWNSSEENNIIPESLLIRMKDVLNISQLLNQFVSDSNDTFMHGPIVGNFTEGSKRALSTVSAPNIATPANCQTEMQVVELDKPENTATIYWPSCVRVRRCGGCCPSTMLACKPLATSIVNVTVLQMFYNHQNPNSFENQGIQTFSLIQHDRCVCACKETAEDCDPYAHDFRPSECRCACKNAPEAASCSGPKKKWDSRHCVCKCRKIRMCSTGLYFNTLTCRCEVLKRSLAVENLNQQNSNTSLSSHNSTTL